MRGRAFSNSNLPATVAIVMVAGVCLLNRSLTGAPSIVMLTTANESGIANSVSKAVPIDVRNPFFLSLGTNGRACVDCHQADQGWSITPVRLRQLFDATNGLAPVFRTNDGSNSP